MKLSDFKTSVLEVIRPPKKDIFELHNPDGIKRIFQLRVGLSPLKAHKKSHNFQDTLSDICLCENGAEDTIHYWLLCSFFSDERNIPFEKAALVVGNFVELSQPNQTHCLLYGFHGLSDTQNSMILNETITFISKTGRFDRETST